MRWPVLLEGHTLTRKAELRPAQLGIKLLADGLSRITMTLEPGAPGIDQGDWIWMQVPNGRELVMQVTSAAEEPTRGGVRTISAEHVFGVLADSLTGDINEDEADIACGDAVRALLGAQKERIWTLGTCAYTDKLPWRFKRQKISAALETVTGCLEEPQWTYDMRRMPFVASLTRRPTTPACEMRIGRNISTIRISRERKGMFTRLYPVGMNDMGIGEANGGVEYIERGTDKHGIIEETLTNASIDNPRVLKAWGRAQLARGCKPIETITITGREMSRRTGVKLDRIDVGLLCRVALPDEGRVITERVVAMEWKDAIADEESVTVTLANEHRTVQGIVKRIKSEAEQTRRGAGGAGAKQQEENKNLWTRITRTEEEIALEAYRLDQRIDGNVANIASIKITADAIESAVQKYDYDDAGKLLEGFYSQISQNASDITLRVAKTDYNGETIASLINVGTNNILIKSERIDLEGYVTASKLSAEFANLQSAISKQLYVEALSAKDFECTSLKFKGSGMSLASQTVVTGITRSKRNCMSSDGMGTVSFYACDSYDTKKIYYMSWE